MGSGGTGAGGAGGGGNNNTGGGGWGSTMGSGGNAYSGGGVGGIGTAGTMSGGAGGSAMGGFGNTGAGGSGMAGISSHGGGTPAGFTGQYGDPRGATIGQDAYGNYPSAAAALGYGNTSRATALGASGLVYKNGVPMQVSYRYIHGEPMAMYTPVPRTTTALTVKPGTPAAPGYVNTPPQQFNRQTLGYNFERSTNPYGPAYSGGTLGPGPGLGPDPSIGNRQPGTMPSRPGMAPGGLDAGPGGPLGYGGTRRM